MTETSKPMWKRCDGCKARIFNEAVDIAAHRANCPADLARRIQKLEIQLTGQLTALETRLDELEGQVDDAAELLTVDPNAVDEDGFGSLDDEITEFEDDLEDPTIPAVISNLPTIGGIA